MKIRPLVVISVISLIVIVAGCSSNSDETTSDDNYSQDTLYLARNIIFNDGTNVWAKSQKINKQDSFSLIPKAYAATIDYTTVIPATNVILDTGSTIVESGNVQDAFNEVLPVVSNILPGTWNVTNYNNGADGQTGMVTFYDDGTFVIDSGTVTVIGGCNLGGCFTALTSMPGVEGTPTVPVNSGVWELVDNSLIKMTLEGNSPQYILLLNFSMNKLTSLRATNLSIFQRL